MEKNKYKTDYRIIKHEGKFKVQHYGYGDWIWGDKKNWITVDKVVGTKTEEYTKKYATIFRDAVIAEREVPIYEHLKFDSLKEAEEWIDGLAIEVVKTYAPTEDEINNIQE